MSEFKRSVWVLAVLLIAAAGCVPLPLTPRAAPATKECLTIPEMHTSMGGENGGATQVFSYTLTLQNTGPCPVELVSLDPVLAPWARQRLVTPDIQILVGRSLAPGESHQVSAVFSLDTGGMTKEEIVAQGPVLERITATTRMDLPLPGRRTSDAETASTL